MVSAKPEAGTAGRAKPHLLHRSISDSSSAQPLQQAQHRTTGDTSITSFGRNYKTSIHPTAYPPIEELIHSSTLQTTAQMDSFSLMQHDGSVLHSSSIYQHSKLARYAGKPLFPSYMDMDGVGPSSVLKRQDSDMETDSQHGLEVG